MNQFFALKTRKDVADILGVPDRTLRFFLYKLRPENMYTKFYVPKKNGTFRIIAAPDNRLKSLQRKLVPILSEAYKPKICAFGFIPEKNYIQGAKKHSNKNLIFNIDLKDFFGQIHFGRIRGMLINPPYSIGEEAATVIAQISCFNGILPQGAPTSPILSNMICAPLDNNLMKLAKESKCIYTRYADDITFSSKLKKFDEKIVEYKNGELTIGQELSKILQKNSFLVNPEKISLRTRHQRQEVTGVTVNVFPNPRRSYIKQLRVLLHKSTINGLYKTAIFYIIKGNKSPFTSKMLNDSEFEAKISNWFRLVLIGKILYLKDVKGVNDFTYLSYARKFNEIEGNEYFDINKLIHINKLIEKYVVVISNVNRQGSGFFVKDYGLFTNFHVVDTDDFMEIKSPLIPKISICKESAKNTDANIDYAQFNFTSFGGFEIGDSRLLTISDPVYIAGFPNYLKDDTPNIQRCHITSQRGYIYGSQFYTVSGTVFHGFSGGVVLNEAYQVVGIVKGGIASMDELDSNSNQGFVPIHLVLDHMNSSLGK